MKTLKQWEESKKDFTEFISPGERIDEKLYDYFLEMLFPAKMTSYGFLVGEPYDHRGENNSARYSAFLHDPSYTKFWYFGVLSSKQFSDSDFMCGLSEKFNV